MQLGINVTVQSYDTPGCIWYDNSVQQSSITRSFADLHFVYKCTGSCSPTFCMANFNRAPRLYTAFLFRIIFTIQMVFYPFCENLCTALVPYCNQSKKITQFISMNWWCHLCYCIMYFQEFS